MQESKEICPHITTKEELDALYKNIKPQPPKDEDTSNLLNEIEK